MDFVQITAIFFQSGPHALIKTKNLNKNSDKYSYILVLISQINPINLKIKLLELINDLAYASEIILSINLIKIRTFNRLIFLNVKITQCQTLNITFKL
ncbi:hypothetical protein BpHYR1_044244 [Brachionus plicatilis]|uniref:Uncharacterized protein n=1 Tax=Brachionus plicatilis TaxID=10195 RepID=A0A3M7PK86_BRAPC|nr:hypothetical protein BpHYR1_044244 [Brachionus plicatilis]